jgi:hypothetical protein
MDEIREYMQEILSLMTTGDEIADFENLERFASMISMQQGTEAKVVTKNLTELRSQYFEYINKGMSQRQANIKMA